MRIRESRGFITVMVVLVLFLGMHFAGADGVESAQADMRQSLRTLGPFTEALEIIENEYVDADEIDSQKLLYGAIKGMLASLEDQHSRFLEPSSFESLNIDIQGEFEGLGIQIAIERDWLTIISPFEGTPAWRAGLKSGDVIAAIEGESTEGITTEEAVQKLRGPRGSQVTITIKRPGVTEPFDVTVTRDRIEVPSIKYTMMNETEKIGYIRLSRFTAHSPMELEEALKDLERQGMKGLIFDLRSNPGGSMPAAVAVSDRFVEEGVIVSSRGRVPEVNRTFGATRANTHTGYPVVILINGGSASSSEIVTGALQDLGRAVVVGEQSYGKGSVQTVRNLSDGSGITITTAKYYTPSGRSIDEVGINPDVVIEAETFSDTDVKALLAIQKAEVLLDLTTQNEELTEEELNRAEELVAAEEIEIRRPLLKRYLIEEMQRRHAGQLILRPDVDPQLAEALTIVRDQVRYVRIIEEQPGLNAFLEAQAKAAESDTAAAKVN